MLFFAATLHKDNILILLAPLVGISSISSSCIRDIGPHQLNDPATVLLRLHLPYDLLKLHGVQTNGHRVTLHYFTCNCKHKQINSKHITSASVVGFWQLRSEICSEDRTAWGNTLMPLLLDDDDSSLRSSSSLASRSLIQLRFAPLDNLPPPPQS